jgi:GGDEF domain-containing protein
VTETLYVNSGAYDFILFGRVIRKQIEDEKPGKDIAVTASIGVVSSEQVELDTPPKLLNAADEAMYVSKFQGKNRVTVCPAPTEELERAKAARAEARGME